ncbi:MAG: protein-disulfide reductase DsbD N-terminal domain-containing protein [Burkholderiales bacterium]
MLRFAFDLGGAACLALAAAAASAQGVPPDELLEPEQAFRISAQPLDERNVQVRFEIAEGYYMYRDRFKFETGSGRVLADVELPPGERKRDPFFGESVTYRRQVAMRVPLSGEDATRGRVHLKVTSQGCSDQGVCYTPLEQIVEVRLASASPAASPTLGDTRGAQQVDGSTTIAPASPPFWALIALLFATAGLIAAVALALLRKWRKPE